MGYEMKKKIWILLASLVVVISGIFLWNCLNLEKDVKRDEYVLAKTDNFETLEELENASECIVRVKKLAEDDSIVERRDGRIAYGYTMSDVKIQEVFYNTLGNEIQKDQIIKIWENEFQDGDIVYHIAGYEKMEIGKEYILFLRKSTSHDCFLTRGIRFGKVSVHEESISTFARNNQSYRDLVDSIAAQARQKYVK